jgi:hypothetical protein
MKKQKTQGKTNPVTQLIINFNASLFMETVSNLIIYNLY